MFLSYNWLRELTETKLSPQEARDRLTGVGLAVDAFEERGEDYVLDVEVPSNRGDCLSHLGIARELAVIEKSKVQSPTSNVKNPQGKTEDLASVEICDPNLCPRYAARIVRGVKIGPSPDWLVKRLGTIGQRAINNVADITNYVLHELGQPLHAFDLARLSEKRIIVRRAAKDETIKTLDGIEQKLDSEMLVIADAKGPVALAGVMGGEDSEISDKSQDVLIESAYFDPASVRRTAKRLGLHTEASHRFERGIDPDGVRRAQDRCVALICEIAGGVATTDAIDNYPKPLPARAALMRLSKVAAVSSLEIATDEVMRILHGLGFELLEQSPDRIKLQIPSWRHDVSIEEDLIEEVARHTGYDKIKSELPPSQLAGEYHSTEKRKRGLRRALADFGFDEAIGFSFIDVAHDGEFQLIPAFADGEEGWEHFVTLQNPIVETWSRMRPSLLPGLLNAVRHNLNQGPRDVCLFELGRLFRVTERGELPAERQALGLVATGGALQADKATPIRDLDFFDVKGALCVAAEAMSLPPLTFEAGAVKHLRAGQSAIVQLNGASIGSIGRLAEETATAHKFRQAVFVAEIDLTTLLQCPEQPVLYAPLPRFPSVTRDVSLLVDRRITVAELLQAAAQKKGGQCERVMFVGVYEGAGIPETRRSVTLRFEYRSAQTTLRDDEVDRMHWPTVEALKEQFNAEVR
jgi:phenylalanyl-tRNA synthetase beta chain